jgi:TPR repeat protein
MSVTSRTCQRGVGLFSLLMLFCVARAAESESEALARAKLANQSRDFATSVAIYQDWSRRGSAAATRFLGLMYWSGYGVAKDRQRACDLYAEAEKKADPSGTELLGDCYFHGDGRSRDYSKSAVLYGRASERGMPQADCALGNQYLLGLGVPKDPAKAFSLCRLSAERGAADAETDLGQMYLSGTGVERDPQQAALWFQKAMDQGQSNGNAALLLGKMRWNGDGVERNHDLAASAWLVAAQHGNTAAPALLSKYYFAASIVAESKQIRVNPATKAVYWGTLATRVDPDPAAREASQKLVDMLLGAAPTLKARADALFASSDIPPL